MLAQNTRSHLSYSGFDLLWITSKVRTLLIRGGKRLACPKPHDVLVLPTYEVGADARAAVVAVVEHKAIVGKFSHNAVVGETIIVEDDYRANVRCRVRYYFAGHREGGYFISDVGVAIIQHGGRIGGRRGCHGNDHGRGV